MVWKRTRITRETIKDHMNPTSDLFYILSKSDQNLCSKFLDQKDSDIFIDRISIKLDINTKIRIMGVITNTTKRPRRRKLDNKVIKNSFHQGRIGRD
jgi:hypothetical protein